MVIVRCKNCGIELESHATKTKCCGCSNMTTICGNKITALDLTQVVMISLDKDNKKASIFSSEDLAYQNARRNRKIKKLDFEIR